MADHRKQRGRKVAKKVAKQIKKRREFSKTLLIQESVLIWIETIAMLVLSFVCILRSSYAELPWLSVMVGLPWTAYGVSQAFYYKKSEKENTMGGIKYESIMNGLELDQPFEENDEEPTDISDEAVG